MGSRGSRSGAGRSSTPWTATTPYNPGSSANANQLLQQVQQLADSDTIADEAPVNDTAITALTQMSDAELASLYRSSQNVELPYHLADRADPTQKFVYAIGLNDRPEVKVGTEFDQYLRDNNIDAGSVLVRGVSAPSNPINVNGVQFKFTAQQILNQTIYGQYNFIGGRYGGSAYGFGTYMGMAGLGRGTGYGNTRMEAVLSPHAKIIGENTLYTNARSFAASHPQFARAVGSISTNNSSIYALVMGYNVVREGSGYGVRRNSEYSNDYYVIIDRKAIVARG